MKRAIIASALILLSGCASVTTGQTQEVAIKTEPTKAECRLSNDKGEWWVKQTPASVVVHRSRRSLNVDCEKGSLAAMTSVKSFTKGAAYGNILAGGIIGAVVDSNNGAAYGYPSEVFLELK